MQLNYKTYKMWYQVLKQIKLVKSSASINSVKFD